MSTTAPGCYERADHNNNAWSSTIVIVGNGQAAIQLATSLRAAGHHGTITMVGDDDQLPYQRPPLSKGFLKGEMTAERLPIKPQIFFETNAITLIRSDPCTAIDRTARTVTTRSGRVLAYDRLAIATGGHARDLPVPGSDCSSVFKLATLADATRLMGALQDGRRAVVIGGGFIGLEFAAAARALGVVVTVLEAQDRLMGRAVSAPVSAWFKALHERHGVEIRTGALAREIGCEAGQVRDVLVGDERLTANLVLIGIGLVPNQELAKKAGLLCGNGILVDRHMTTSDPQIIAIGDCACHPNAFSSTPLRLESVQNAIDQAKTAAATLLGENDPGYHAVPWFWSDQHGARLQIAGLGHEADAMLVKETDESGLTVCLFRSNVLVAVETVNRPGVHMIARKLIAAASRPSRADIEAAGDLKSLLAPVPARAGRAAGKRSGNQP